MRVFLSFEYGVYSVHVNPSTVLPLKAKMCCFATRTFAQEKLIRLYFGTLVFETMLDALNARSFYGEGGTVAKRR